MTSSNEYKYRVKRDRSSSTRNRRLHLVPFCTMCAAHGVIRATRVIDHIIPLAFGGPDTDDNCQGLCHVCNTIKTALDGFGHPGDGEHPAWLEPSAAKLTIVTGPPFAGKTAFVLEHAEPEDIVVDLHEIVARLAPGHQQWRATTTPRVMRLGIRVRNQLLGSLAREKGKRAWFVVPAASPMERAWWSKKLGGELVCLEPEKAICLERAQQAGVKQAQAAVEQWYSDRRQSWHAPAPRMAKRGCDAQGYPLEFGAAAGDHRSDPPPVNHAFLKSRRCR